MVADVLDMEPEELLQTLRDIRQRYADDPDYQRLRGSLPADWSI